MFHDNVPESSSVTQNQQILDALLSAPADATNDVLATPGRGDVALASQLNASARPNTDFGHVQPLAQGPAGVTGVAGPSRRGPRQSVCIRCRRSKLRCDRQWPCLHCKRHNVTCQYPNEQRLSLSSGGTANIQRPVGVRRRASDYDETSTSLYVSGLPMQASPYSVPHLPWSAQMGWRDYLFNFFGADRAQGQRQIVSLLRRVPRWMYTDHIYNFVHMYAPIRAIVRPDEPTDVHPALMYALVSYALRMSYAPPINGLIPREGVPTIEDPDHPANQLQREAEIMLAQTLTDQNVGVEHGLALALAAAMIMKLQPELSKRYIHYQDIVSNLSQSPLFLQYTDGLSQTVQGITFTGNLTTTANENFVSRDSIRQEEAARLRLIVIWSSFRGGFVYPNIEVLRGRFRREDWLNATIFAPFADEPAQRSPQPPSPMLDKRFSSPSDLVDDLRYDIGAEDVTGFMRTMSFKARALNSIWRCASSWQVPALDYTRPIPELEEILQQIDQGDQSIVAMQQNIASKASSSLMHKIYFAKRVVAIAFLQGFLIRRIGFAHCSALRNDLVEALGAVRDKTYTKRRNSMAHEQPFASPTFKAWLHLMTTFLTELEVDYQSYKTISTESTSAGVALPRISHFSLDSLSLYAAASQQYSDGVAQAFSILGHPDPTAQPLAIALRDSSSALRAKVQRHRTVHMQCGNPRRIIDRAVLIE